MNVVDNVGNKRFGAKILLHKNGAYGDAECVGHWKDYPFHTFMRWQWYFRYRTAITQVANPKSNVVLHTFSYEFVPSADEQRKRIKDRLTAKKAKLTQWRNKLALHVKNWTYWLPVEDDADYKKAIEKVNNLAVELETMEREYEELTLSLETA